MKVLFNKRGMIYNTNIKDNYSDWCKSYQVTYLKDGETKFTYHKNLNIISKKFLIDKKSLYHSFPNIKNPVFYILDIQTKDENSFFIVNVNKSETQFWNGFVNLKTKEIAYYETQEFYDNGNSYEEILVAENVDYIFKATPYKDIDGNVIFEGDIVINDFLVNFIDAYIVKKSENGYILESYDESGSCYPIEDWLDCNFYRCIKFEKSEF